VEACQLTLITEQELAWAEGRAGRPLRPGFHRRNLVVAGLMPKQLREQRLQIGEALFVWHRPRPPCGYLDRVSGAGMARALGKGSGCCLKVLASGLIRVGDPVLVLDSK
jgi:MOSC domain-containing protein YiiM